jgi:hypothetical protein
MYSLKGNRGTIHAQILSVSRPAARYYPCMNLYYPLTTGFGRCS